MNQTKSQIHAAETLRNQYPMHQTMDGSGRLWISMEISPRNESERDLVSRLGMKLRRTYCIDRRGNVTEPMNSEAFITIPTA